MKGSHHRRPITLAVLLGLGLASAPAMSEDIEVFLTKQSNNVAPNVLFILDSSRSMNEVSGGKSRMQVLKESLNAVLKPQQAYKKLNVGIMDFGGSRSGGIDFPITDINSDANLVDGNIPAGTDVGTVLDYIAKSYTTTKGTPMGDALYFASSYYSGMRIFKNRSLPYTWSTSTNSYSAGNGNREADNPAAYTGSVNYTTQPAGERSCSPSSPRPIRKCGSTYSSCTTETGTITARTGSCRIQENNRICDSTGYECYDNWRTISTVSYDGTNRPVDPDGSGNLYRVHCTNPRTASSYTYEHCRESTTKKVWDPTPIYKTPITHQCQSNYVVLLSDGEPMRRDTLHHIATRASPVIGSNRYQDCADLSSLGSNIHAYGRCMPELVQYMAEYDQSPSLPGDQTISTYTIGFMLGGNTGAQDFLTLLAEKSKQYGRNEGQYFNASKSSDLVSIFKKIISDVTGSSVSFAPPSVSVDPNNRLATSKYLYRPEFTPSDKPAWSGDIIKTELGYDSNGNPTFTDDQTTLASTLVASQRKIYTYLGTTSDLKHGDNALSISNSKLTDAQLQLSANVDRDTLIRWARGIDVKDDNSDGDTTDERKHMGDSLHTTPALVNYTNGDQILFVTTNDGLLHAFKISGNTPEELFAFIPPELLRNLNTLYLNSNTAKQKVYGLDGNMAIWRDNENNKVYLYVGMRRGGRNYYAIDITNPADPKWLWSIKGGTGDFAELGQTWSTPQLTNVMVGSTKTMALIFGGGYDTDQDDQTTNNMRVADDQGRAIYVVNAKTGKKIWSAGPGSNDNYSLALSNSIPSDVRIIDLDGNGLADRLYVGDMGGRVWRIDLDQTGINGSSGYQLAGFSADNSTTNNRRFYYAPSVAFDRQYRLMVAIGSGYRAHPTETTTEDRFYAFEDRDAFLLPTTSRTALTEADLDDITNTSGATGNKLGWFLQLHPTKGEKMLAEPIIFNNKVIFTTYQPNFQGNNNTCNLSGNIPRAYVLALEDGQAVTNLNGNSQGQNTRFMSLASVKFIPGSPYITFSNPAGGLGGSGSGGGGSPGGGNPPPGPNPGPCATAYVGQDVIDTFCRLGKRVSWRNF